MSWRRLVLVGVPVGLASLSVASEPGVEPAGTYSFPLPGLAASAEARPKALLWCQGANLVGVVVPDEKDGDCDGASRKRPAPTAFPLRDGRCGGEQGTVSFGFLVSRTAWVFEAAGGAPAERTTWLLHRFEGSLKSGRLSGTLVQIDVDHPGYPFRTKTIDAERLPAQQASFSDETAWRKGIGQTYCLSSGGP